MTRSERGRQGGARGDGQGLGHRSRRLRSAARRHQAVRQAGRRRRLHDERRPADDHGPRRAASRSTTACSARARSRGRDRHRLSPTATCSATSANVKLRFDADLHEAGRRRQALTSAARADGGGRHATRHQHRRPSTAVALPARLAAVRPARCWSTSLGSARASAPTTPTTSCCRALRARWRRDPSRWPSSRTSAPASICCGPIRRRAWSALRIGLGDRDRDRARRFGMAIGILPLVARACWRRSSPSSRWCRRWRCCRSCSSSSASASPRRSR